MCTAHHATFPVQFGTNISWIAPIKALLPVRHSRLRQTDVLNIGTGRLFLLKPPSNGVCVMFNMRCAVLQDILDQSPSVRAEGCTGQ